MKLRKVDFRTYVFGQSGVQGFFGEGDEYRHHTFLKYIPGFSFINMGFVAKTMTMKPRIYPEASNTELRDGYKIKDFFPSSIWWNIRSVWKGYLLNAVGLANPGAEALLGYCKWQNRGGPFQLSFMPMESSPEGKFREAAALAVELNRRMPFHQEGNTYGHIYGIQVNVSCPNTGHGNKQDTYDTIVVLQELRKCLPGAPLILKFDLLVEPETIVALKPYCDAFMISNTLAFGKKSEHVNWKKLFRGGVSPLLKHFQGRFSGGLSGAPLFPLLIEWLKRMQSYDSTVVIIAGGGIMKKADIAKLAQFKIVHAVALGSVAILRPWRVQGLINYGNKIFSQRNKQ